MDAWNTIQQGIQQIAQQLAEGGANGAAILAALVSQLVAIATASAGMEQRLSRTEDGMSRMTQAAASEIRQLSDRVAQLEGRGSSQHRKQGILDCRSVSSIKVLSNDKTTFRTWNEKLINVVSQARPGTRVLFKAMAEFVEQDMEGTFSRYFSDSGGLDSMVAAGTSLTDMKEDLYILLVEKTEGEAMSRLRGCQVGDGIQTYMVLYKWFM